MNDPFVSCPYFAQHRVPRSRIQAHIVKCKHQDPSFAICPYNATHRMPADRMKVHVQNCPSKEAMFPDRLNETLEVRVPVKRQKPVAELDPEHEFWDD